MYFFFYFFFTALNYIFLPLKHKEWQGYITLNICSHFFLFMINTMEMLWDELQMERGMRLSATEKLILNQNFGNICVTSFHFTWQTELLKVLMQVWACIKFIFCNPTNRLIPHCKNVAFCLLIYPLCKIVQRDATKLHPKHSVPCSA